ncbi:MAG: hypothetical protein IPL88_00745 [Rhizobiales bacterium]|nr:hypothetical protein [Hyphomicrobiales bacterium]
MGEPGPAPAAPWLYPPWIREHGDALFAMLAAAPGAPRLAPVRLYPEAEPHLRLAVSLMARREPARFRRAMRARLAAAMAREGAASGLLVSFDWSPVMRMLVAEARALGLPTAMLLHEGVFFDEALYYGGAGVAPVADRALVWGGLHRDLFAARGFPADRIAVVGSAKLSAAAAARPSLDAREWRARLDLDADRPVALFALQPLDNVADPETARATQRRAVADAARATAGRASLVLRPPPADLPGLLPDGARAGALGPHVRVVAPGPEPERAPGESVAQCALALSMGSTMLIEAAAMGRAALVVAYDARANGVFDALDLPRARDGAELARWIERLVAGAATGPSQATHARLIERFGQSDDPAAPLAAIVAELARLARPTPAPARVPRFDPLAWHLAVERRGLPKKLAKLLQRPEAFFRDARRPPRP